MNVADSSAWLEFFGEGKLASEFSPVIEDHQNLIVPSIVVYEVHKRIAVQRGTEAANKAVSFMRRGRFIPLEEALAVEASNVSREHKLAMADAIIYATALANAAEVWTTDGHFENLPNVRYFEKK